MTLKRGLPTVLLFLVSTQLSAQETTAPEGSPGATTETSTEAEPDVAERVSVNDVTSDEAIERRLSEVLRATEWFDDVSVEVRDSVTFLDGSASAVERKKWAMQLARNTEGVAAVVNRIEVKKTIDFSRTLDVVYTSVKNLWDDFLMQSPLIIAGLLALMLTAVIAKVTQYVASAVTKRSRLRGSLQDLILQLLTIGVWVMGLLVSAVIMFPGMTPSKALTVLGVGSVAIGFAFKDIFENFFAGILILWKYPFDKGDFIACGDIRGRIEDITIRMSMIRQVDGQLVVVPNAALFKNPVDVLTDKKVRRTTVICGVAYDTDLNDARTVIQRAVEGCSSVDGDHDVEIFAQEFGDSSINFEVTWWTASTPLDIRKSRDEVVRAVKQALDDAEIEIPFPQRTLWLPEPIETKDSVESGGGRQKKEVRD